MISDFIINAIFGSINALLGLLPTWTLPNPSIGDGITGLVYDMRRIWPITDFVTALIAFFAMRTGIMVWDFIVYVYHQFWGGD